MTFKRFCWRERSQGGDVLSFASFCSMAFSWPCYLTRTLPFPGSARAGGGGSVSLTTTKCCFTGNCRFDLSSLEICSSRPGRWKGKVCDYDCLVGMEKTWEVRNSTSDFIFTRLSPILFFTALAELPSRRMFPLT